MAGTFEIYKDKAGAFRFRLKDTNGQVIVTVGGYETKASAIEGIESVQKNAPGAKIEDLSEVSSANVPPTPPPSGVLRKGAPPPIFPRGLSLPSWQQDQAWRARCMGRAGTMTSQ